MYVPNYIPDPLEVPGNVTEEKYRTRVRFIRRVAELHFLSLLAIALLSTLPLPAIPLIANLIEIAALLFILCVIRIITRAKRADLIASTSILPAVLISVAMAAKTLNGGGWPIWGALVGAACALIYALSCGRDFSFVGQFFLSLIVSTSLLAIAATSVGYSPRQAAFLMGTNGLYLFFLVYDSASLLARRRVGEEWAAVVDLYRDVLNVFGYLLRVARHWRKHRIWAR